MTNRVKKALRASTLALLCLPIASNFVPGVYAQEPAVSVSSELRTLDEIYAQARSREVSKAEANARVDIAQIQTDANYKIASLRAASERLRAEGASQNVLDNNLLEIEKLRIYSVLEIERIKANLAIELRNIEADLERDRREDQRTHEHDQIVRDLHQIEAEKAVKLAQIQAAHALEIEKIETAKEKARLDAIAQGRREFYASVSQANEALRIFNQRVEQIRLGRIASADAYNHRFFRKLREQGQARDRLYFANQAAEERASIVTELNAGLIH